MVFGWFQSSAAVAATVAAQTATKFERMANAEQRLLEFARAYAQSPTPTATQSSTTSASSSSHIIDEGGSSSSSSSSSSWLQIETFDTRIPRSTVPLKGSATNHHHDGSDKTKADASSLVIHGVHVQSRPNDQRSSSSSSSSETTSTPLVLLHGYMNAGSYFYRNFGGLARYFTNIYAIDMLGWGMSSRPSMDELVEYDTDGATSRCDHQKKKQRTTNDAAIMSREDRSVRVAEDWFVESLEAWRAAHKIDKMVLAGHSFGGYMSVAYTERYPERVERLVLLSPVGVPDESDPSVHERRERYQSTWRGRMFLNVFQSVFERTTIGTVLRNYMSEERSYGAARNYVTRRLPEISDPNESKAVADYLYYNSVLPGSGEFFVHNILTGMVMARKPLQFRIPNLKIDSVTILYGSTDWMDISGGLNTQLICESINEEVRDNHSMSPTSSKPVAAPAVKVYMVPNAGHLLMLQNWEGTNNGIIHAAGGTIPSTESAPKLLHPTREDRSSKQKGDTNSSDVHGFWVQKTLQSRGQVVPSVAN